MTLVQQLVSGVKDVKIFVPSKDFERSMEFYRQLGWTTNWIHSHSLAELQIGATRIYLQKFYNRDWARNFMIYLEVDDAHGWYQHIHRVIQNGSFDEARCVAPKEEDHALVTYVWDPCGVLLHFAQAY